MEDLQKMLFDIISEDQDFQNMNTIEQKIESIFRNDEIMPLMDYDLNELVIQSRDNSRKNLVESQVCRENGRLNLIENDYFSAFDDLYSAIIHAPVPPEGQNLTAMDDLYLAYRLRSNALYGMEDYDGCLFDVNICLSYVNEVELILKKVQCLYMLNRVNEAQQTINQVLTNPDLILRAHELNIYDEFQKYQESLDMDVIEPENIPVRPEFDLWYDQRCSFVSSQDRGRYMRALGSIEKDTTIFYEKAAIFILYEDYLESNCNNCSAFIDYKLWPCRGCTEVGYCCRGCEESAWIRFHRFECGIISLFHSIQFEYLFAFRLFACSGAPSIGLLNIFRNNYFHSQETIFRVNEWNELHRNSVRTDIKQFSEVCMEFLAILTYKDNKDRLSPDFIRDEVISAFICTILIRDHTNAFDFGLPNGADSLAFTEFLLTVRLKLTFNAFPSKDLNTDRHIGIGIWIMGCFINHSCLPNTEAIGEEQFLTFKTKIDVNDCDLTISYGPDSMLPFFERQKVLKNDYNFLCLCVLCEEQARSELTIQCLNCEGPVVYSPDVFPNDECSRCYTQYPDIDQVYQNCSDTYDQLLGNVPKGGNDSWDNFDKTSAVGIAKVNHMKEDVNYLLPLVYRNGHLFPHLQQILQNLDH